MSLRIKAHSRYRAIAVIVILLFASGPAGASSDSGELNSPGDSSGEPTEISAPTIPTPPPVLPSYYNNPIFADQRETAGRSLNFVFSVCGDTVYDPGEECDDGNRQDGDGCSSICHLEDLASCGNGKRDPGETCDDGNVSDGDGCSATCQNEGRCGDGSLDPGEQCDDGNTAIGDGCSSKCLFEVRVEEKTPDSASPAPKTSGEIPGTRNKNEEEQSSENPKVEIVPLDGGTEKRVEYIEGRGITAPPGCSARCTVAREYEGNTLKRQYEVQGERQITGGTYTNTYGEFDCRTGQSVNQSSGDLRSAAEDISNGTSAEILSCAV